MGFRDVGSVFSHGDEPHRHLVRIRGPEDEISGGMVPGANLLKCEKIVGPGQNGGDLSKGILGLLFRKVEGGVIRIPDDDVAHAGRPVRRQVKFTKPLKPLAAEHGQFFTARTGNFRQIVHPGKGRWFHFPAEPLQQFEFLIDVIPAGG